MATVTPPPPQAWNRDDSQRRVTHPLQRLRSTIRSYVTAEGLAVLGLYLALWFWISLLLDYGFFKVSGVDWVQVLPWGLRAAVLGIVGAGLLALVSVKLLVRLVREFRAPALALVLERRFPDELGDRLITAVELADPKLARRYGYSQAMIDQTVRDAAARVERLPVAGVFDWRRLRRYVVRVVLLTVVLYLLVGAGYCLYARAGAEEFAVRFDDVAAIWFERNVLLADTIWPRQAHLELLNFPASGDLRVGRDAPPPALHIRAWKWVIADKRAPEGWRPLRWADLTPELLGGEMPFGRMPAAWQSWTVDEVELQLPKPEAQAALDAETILALESVLERLEERTRAPRMGRRLRLLKIPDKVVVYYKGETVRSEQTLRKQADNEYTGVLSDLKESVRFTANGEDYYTPYKQITVVPPPGLAVLVRDEEQPAYLYQHPPAGGGPKDLRGKKQVFKDLPVSLSGSASRLEVPVGTNVVLMGKTDKELRPLPDGVRLRPREGSAPVNVPVRLGEDRQSFAVRFDNITAALDIEFQFTDTDNVIGRRVVVIKPQEDMPPDVDVVVEVVRRTNQGYLVTPSARIPFSGKVRDDHGLASLDYTYTLAPLEGQAVNASPIVSLLQFVPSGPAPRLLMPAYLAWVGKITRAAADEASRPPNQTPVATFARRQKESAAGDVPLAELEKQLLKKPEQIWLREHTFEPEEESFDLEPLRLKVSDEGQLQPRYRMRLWLVATDSNVETGPGIGESKEKFTILIVPENELLAEVAKEEESLHLKLDDTVNRLKDARNKLDQVGVELPSLRPGVAQEFSPMALRVEEIVDTLVKSWDITREVYIDYRKILKELQVNRVRSKIQEKVEFGICEPLDGAINQEFVRADEALRAFHKTLEDRRPDMPAATLARQQLDQLIDRLTRVLDAMGDISNLNKVIEELVKIEKQQRQASERYNKKLGKEEEDILKGLEAPPGPGEKKP